MTDDNEIAVAKAVPTNKAEYDAFQTKLAEIVRAHGIAVNAGDKWYPVNMFEAYTSTFNGNARKAVGLAKASMHCKLVRSFIRNLQALQKTVVNIPTGLKLLT